ncbi:MAG: phosphate acyltransferase PlsX [Bacteroidales bacterium]|nr:phosphate acyltransferase PlsX [Lentimicrobiaceae bacterium]MDD5694160.1 phosphate acyltransferase PlsX [Bacteroidales bacterium]
MKIGLDVMGGDRFPDATVGGAIQAYREMNPDDRIVLIGDERIIHDTLVLKGGDPSVFEIVHASDVIHMHESPARAFLQKPHSSISVGFKLLKDNRIDAFASAGSSGAMMVGSIYSVNVIQGIIRPATTAIIPKENGGVTILLDVGTNPDLKPDVMYQLGILGSVYTKYVYHIDNPRVGLLNIGEEDIKGNLLCQSSFQLMKDSRDFHFIGNVEGRALFNDKADVVVCDGYTGNVLLKALEQVYFLMKKRGLVDGYFERFNYENFGGTPILGINAPVMVGHGISNERAIKNMILLSKEVSMANLPEKIRHSLIEISNNT